VLDTQSKTSLGAQTVDYEKIVAAAVQAMESAALESLVMARTINQVASP
jgi:hypothetical protein